MFHGIICFLLFSVLFSVLFVRVLSCLLALNVCFTGIQSGLGIVSQVVLHVGTHPEIRHAIAQSLSRDSYVVFESINLPKLGGTMQMRQQAEPRPFPFLLGK